MLYALLMAAGKGSAQNPSMSVGGSGEHSLLSKLDPIGNAITGLGGDPLNLYGNKNNPNALLFPGTTGANASGAYPYTAMQSGMSPDQMAMIAKMGGGQGNLGGAFNNYLSAIGQPRMQTQQPQQPPHQQLLALMQGARGGMQMPGRGMMPQR